MACYADKAFLTEGTSITIDWAFPTRKASHGKTQLVSFLESAATVIGLQL
jgi:hypothetical protein